MRIINRSRLPIPGSLWRLLAQSLRIDGTLPGTDGIDAEMYARRDLRVIVHAERETTAGTVRTSGTYSFGTVRLYPCYQCTEGFLTHVFIHELVHCWLDQYHEDRYLSRESCTLAEQIADASFRNLGGEFDQDICGSYRLDVRSAQQLVPRAAREARRLLADELIRTRRKDSPA
jgi:hypothetical protein